MKIPLLAGRLLLSLVFVVAKLADRQGSRRAVTDFGAPRALATPLAILLPVVELAAAVALIPTRAPEVKLPDLAGNTVDLADFKDEETLVLFWKPGCGFCRQMLPDLKEWESEAPDGAPKLLMISAGSEEANREMSLASPVLLDQSFAAGRAFGASRTPSAVLVNAEGKVASEVAVRGSAVLELAGADETTT